MTSIDVTPANTNVFRAGAKQFTATGTYSDSSTQDITSSVTWSSSDATIAAINSAGLATASADKSGPVTITATSGSISGSAQLMVAVSLPKTGQTTSYATGDDGNLQRGVAWPSPRFTDNGNGTVTDNLTGLMWTKDANAPGPAGCTPAVFKRWQEALDYVACLNTNNYLGYTDWRLPNRKELGSLINYGQAQISTWLTGQGFSVPDGTYWSSSTYAGSATSAASLSMDGNVYALIKTFATVFVWPVRAGDGGAPADLPKTGQTTCYDASGAVITCTSTGQDGELQKGVAWPSQRFTDNGNGTVTDNLTGLIWTKDANAPGPAGCTPSVAKTWQDALNYVTCLNTNNYLGYSDWRLPNANELRSLINYEQVNSALWLNGQGFSNVQAFYYWSSSTYAFNTTYARVVNMFVGNVSANFKTNTYYVWPVRAGQ